MNIRRCLWHLLRFRLWLYLLGAVLSWGYYTLPLLFGLILRAFFNALSGEAEVRFDVWSLAGFFLGVQVALQLFEQGYAATYAYFEGCLKTLIRKNLFRGILKDGELPTAQSPGEIINRFEEDADGVADPIAFSMGMSGQAVSAITALGVMLSINPLIALCAFLPMIGIAMTTRWMGEGIQRYHRTEREAAGRVSGFLGELLGSVQAVKVAGTDVSATRHFETLSEVRRRAVLNNLIFSQVLNSANTTTINLATGVILMLAGHFMSIGAFTLGDFALFVSYVALGEASLSRFARGVGRLLASFKKAEVSLGRLCELLVDHAPSTLVAHGPVYLQGGLPALRYTAKTEAHRLASLRVEGLSCRHPETGRGIEGISFELKRGSFTVITGRIGSGKTTLIETLLGLAPRDRGEILWNGQRISDPASFLVPPRCAYTPQVPYLFSDSLRDNILMGIPEEAADLHGAIHRAVMEQDVASLEKGLDTVIGPRGVRLSGGQIQRTATARMFVRNPELVVLDDLSSALDVETERLLWERISAQRGITCLVVSHRRAVLRHASHILVLKEGKVEAQGGLDELLKECEEMQQIWRGLQPPPL